LSEGARISNNRAFEMDESIGLRLSRARFVTATTGALAAASLPRLRSSADPLPVVRVGINASDTYAEPFYAEAGGFFKDAGLDVQVVMLSNTAATASALAGGSLDVGISSLTSIAQGHERGLPFAAFAPAGMFSEKVPTTLLMVAKDSPLKSPRDLEGKTIATIDVRGVTEVSMDQWAAANGADATSFKYIEMLFGAMAAAVATKRVDAAVIAEPALTPAFDTCREFGNPYATIAKQWYIAVFFARPDWIAANADVARRFAGAIQKTAVWANGHRPQSAAMLSDMTKLPVAVTSSMRRVTYAEKLDVALMQPMLDAAAKAGVLKGPVAARDLIAKGFI
jgi:NitT/TauT family transport system substrate-binding protein